MEENEIITTDTPIVDGNIEEVLEVENTEVVTIDIDEVLISLDGEEGHFNHALLNNREMPNQHPIIAIEGLRQELDNIEALQTVYSDKKQQADYYMWYQNETEGYTIPANPCGLFVSIQPNTDKVKICDGTCDVFGVTVYEAAFVGNQEYVQAEGGAKTGRDGNYVLVTHSGLVDVRCETTVAVGDYVVPNDRGEAKKSDGDYGYLVTAVSDENGLYACISLGAASTLANTIADSVHNLSGRMNNAEQNIISVGEVANSAYALAEDVRDQSILDIARLNKELNDTIDKVDVLDAEVDELANAVKNTSITAEQAKVIANSAVNSAESMRNTAVATANDALAEAKRTNANLDAYKTIVANIDKYTVGEYSQANGLTWQQAKDILEVDMIYVPVEGTATDQHTEVYSDNYTQRFIRGCYYTWTRTIWNESNANAVIFVEDGVYVEGSLLSPYLVVENEDMVDDNNNVYTKDTLFVWQYNEENKEYLWVPITTISKNIINRTVALIRSEADSIGLEVTNVKGDVSALDVRVGNAENSLTTVTTWKSDVEADISKIATIEQKASENRTSIALVVSETEEGEVVNTASIVNAINDDESSVTIKADKINFEGFTTFLTPDDVSDNGSTTIDGGRILTGTIAADRLNITDIIKVGSIAQTGDIPTKEQITTITNNTIQTTNVVAEYLQVPAANITGTLTANQIDADGIEAEDVTVTGTINATSGTIGGCTIEDGNLKVNAANITGTLTIGQLPESVAETSDIPTNDEITKITNDTIQTTNVTASNLKVNAANINGTLTIGQLPDNVAETGDIPTEAEIVTISKGAITADYIKSLNLEVGNQIKMGEDATISWGNVTNTDNIASKDDVSTAKNEAITTANEDATTKANNAKSEAISEIDDRGYQNTSQVTEITKDTIKTTNVVAENLRVKAANIEDKLTASQIDATGIKAVNADITGKITATEGEIGGFTINETSITGGIIKSDSYKPVVVISTESWNENNKDLNTIYYVTYNDSNLYYVHNGSEWSDGLNENPQSGTQINMSSGTFDSKNFQIDENGNVSITGDITATSGTIEAGEVIVNGILDACIIKTQGLIYDAENNEVEDPEGIYIDLQNKKHLYVGGKIVATSGEIGGLKIENGKLQINADDIHFEGSQFSSQMSQTISTAKQEAINSAADSVDEKLKSYSTTTQTQSLIDQKAEGITLSVSETYSTKNETEEAKEAAITSANNSTDDKLKNYSTTTEMNSAINQKADSITLSVSETINNIKIGGRNLACRSSISHSKNGITCTETIGADGGYSWNITKTAATSGTWISESVFEVGEIYTLSFYFQKTGGTLINIGGHTSGYELLSQYIDGEPVSGYGSGITISDNTNKHYVVITFKAHKNASDNNNNVYIQPNRKDATSVTYNLWGIQVEKGNKATDWTPAPEDIDKKFNDYATIKETQSLIDQKADNITLTVSQTYSTKAEVNGLSDRLTEAESSISINKDGIESKVSKDGIVSAINQSPETITIDAKYLNLNGYATFTALETEGETIIHGGNIKTDSLAAISADLGTVTSGCIQSPNYPGIIKWNADYSLNYTLNTEETEYTVTGITANRYVDVEIPAIYNDKPVTSIQASAFKSKSFIKSVTIPDSVISIGTSAFQDCTRLTRVIMGDSVTSIGSSAFSGCTSLISVIGGDSVTSIEKAAFYNCFSLTSVTIGDRVTSIGTSAFTYCNSLESIIIPKSVTTIRSNVFSHCVSLTIYCEASSQPNGWNSSWNPDNCPVYWYIEAEPTDDGNYWHYGNSSFKISCNDNNMIESEYFKVSSEGRIEAASGTIGCANIETNRLDFMSSNGELSYTLGKDGIDFAKGSLDIGPVSFQTNGQTAETCTKGTYKIYCKDDNDTIISSITLGGDNSSTEESYNIQLKIKGTGAWLNGKGEIWIATSKPLKRTFSIDVYYAMTGYGQQFSINYKSSKRLSILAGKTESTHLTVAGTYNALDTWLYATFNKDMPLITKSPNTNDIKDQFVCMTVHNDQSWDDEKVAETCEITQTEINSNINIVGNLIPTIDNSNLGDKEYIWESAHIKTITCNNCLTDSDLSDIRVKNSIENLSQKYETFFDKMQPVRYKYNEGTSNRYHTGFIAQDLVSSLEESGLTTQDLAGVVLTNPNTEDERWYLRRDEFVALNTWQIQKLKKRVEELEDKLNRLSAQQNN